MKVRSFESLMIDSLIKFFVVCDFMFNNDNIFFSNIFIFYVDIFMGWIIISIYSLLRFGILFYIDKLVLWFFIY